MALVFRRDSCVFRFWPTFIPKVWSPSVRCSMANGVISTAEEG